MNLSLQEALPRLLPKAIAWAEERERNILKSGRPLTPDEVAAAMRVGVQRPEEIRVMSVPSLPQPADRELRLVALNAGLLGPRMVGLTLGYGIYICMGHERLRLVAHECRHVYQYEQAGSIASFLPMYLGEIVRVGYDRCSYEVDARTHET